MQSLRASCISRFVGGETDKSLKRAVELWIRGDVQFDTYHVHGVRVGDLARGRAFGLHTQPHRKRCCDLGQHLYHFLALLSRHDHLPCWKIQSTVIVQPSLNRPMPQYRITSWITLSLGCIEYVAVIGPKKYLGMWGRQRGTLSRTDGLQWTGQHRTVLFNRNPTVT